MTEAVTLLIPFLGTSLGAAMVFFIKNKIAANVEKVLLGFASGVMIAASVWSLLLPSIEMTGERGKIAWLPAAAGFAAGTVFLMLLDAWISHFHPESEKREGSAAKLPSKTMLLLAVTLHNIPEGMAVGVAYAGALTGKGKITVAGALALSLGIAIQNFPEGAIISMPLKGEGMGRGKAFLCGVLSGAVEPAGGFITVLLAEKIQQILPYMLAFAAGAMMYVVIEELIPEAQEGENCRIGTIGAALGFVLMMVLDVALG